MKGPCITTTHRADSSLFSHSHVNEHQADEAAVVPQDDRYTDLFREPAYRKEPNGARRPDQAADADPRPADRRPNR